MLKYILPIDKYIKHLPDYSTFRRKTTLRKNPDYIPDLHCKLVNTYHTTGIGQTEIQNTTASVHTINVETL